MTSPVQPDHATRNLLNPISEALLYLPSVCPQHGAHIDTPAWSRQVTCCAGGNAPMARRRAETAVRALAERGQP